MKSQKDLDAVIAKAVRDRDARERDYRAQSLKIHPWVCGRCGREFTRENLHELTVHHKDHNHSNNPPDGSNWELLCLYCHDQEHQDLESGGYHGGATRERHSEEPLGHNPFAGLGDMITPEDED